MEKLILKYQTSASEVQKEITDFADFIISKAKKKTTTSLKAWKKRILSVSIWSSHDLEALKKNTKGLKSWKSLEW